MILDHMTNTSTATHIKLTKGISWWFLYSTHLWFWLIDNSLVYVPFENTCISFNIKTSSLPVKGCNFFLICPAFMGFVYGGIFIVSHLLWHGASVFAVSVKAPPHSVAFLWQAWGTEDPGPHRIVMFWAYFSNVCSDCWPSRAESKTLFKIKTFLHTYMQLKIWNIHGCILNFQVTKSHVWWIILADCHFWRWT